MAGKRKVLEERPGAQLPAPAAEPAEPASAMTPAQEAQLASDLAATARSVGAADALDWSSLNQGTILAENGIDPDAGLPLSADPRAIDQPVLTKGGWVMPEIGKAQ